MIENCQRRVVIVADRDPPKTLQNGSQFFPGQEGAIRLAKQLKPLTRSVRMIKPPSSKDMREWYRTGATKAMVTALVNNARFE